ncbi:MAG: hypothetical protein HZB68_03830 [Candidatus Aenigmarchaeota archaeon]|nr:hypothetical protein [Candidatus Aenigmarchaeota archaeon]
MSDRIKRLKKRGSNTNPFVRLFYNYDSEAYEDYDAMLKKVQSLFPGPLYAIDSDEKKATFDFSKGIFKISPKALRYCSVGQGMHYVIHEVSHFDQSRELGREDALYLAVKNDAFIEGDAEIRTLKRLASPKGERELLMSFSSINEKIRSVKIINGKGVSYERYVDYLFAPAVVLELEERGKSQEEIREIFESSRNVAPSFFDDAVEELKGAGLSNDEIKKRVQTGDKRASLAMRRSLLKALESL